MKKSQSKQKRIDPAVTSNSSCMGIVCTKSLAIIFNFLLIINGVSLILLSLYTINYKQDYADLLNSHLYQASTYILLTSGILIIIISIFGIFSGWKESRQMLIAYLMLLSLVILTEITAAVLVLTYRIKLNETLKDAMNFIILSQYAQPGFEAQTKAFDELQAKFKCCGAVDFSDWSSSSYILSQKISPDTPYNKVAESCCKSPSTLCAVRDHPSNIYSTGCVPTIETNMSEHILVYSLLVLGCCVFQVCGIFIVSLLVRRINQRKPYEFIENQTSEIL